LTERKGIDAVTLSAMGSGYRGREVSYAIACRRATPQNWITFLEAYPGRIEHVWGPKTEALASPRFQKWCKLWGISALFLNMDGDAEPLVIKPT